jgi:hypothetical protein
MKKFLKGCLIIFAILFGITATGSIAMYIYWQSPNKIVFSDSPIKKEKYLNSLSFENRQLPDFILKQNESDILYQALIKDDGLDMTVIYKVVVKLNKDIELANSLPFKPADKKEINAKITFNKIDNNGFNPQITISEDKKTQSGRHMIIFSPQNKILLTLKNGWYSHSHDEVGNEGYVSDIIIYDKDSKLLYFERQRYFAFQ